MNNVTFKLTEGLNHTELYEQFYESISDSTGTMLIHHGKAKYPGKYIADYKKIDLFVKNPDAENILYEKTNEIYRKYNFNKLLVVHNIGIIKKNDPILFLAAEAKDRVSAFDGVRELLEIIKDETLLGLTEIA